MSWADADFVIGRLVLINRRNLGEKINVAIILYDVMLVLFQ